MKLTCLSKGNGFHFPPCHVLNICGFQILLECPLNLSALLIFSPIPDPHWSMNHDIGSGKKRKIDSLNSIGINDLISAEPMYKTVKNLHLLDVSTIDIVLVSTPAGMLGLPFLTREKGFHAKIYATEVTAKLGQLKMEELVWMHGEMVQCYGRCDSGLPEWLDKVGFEKLAWPIREILMGNQGSDIVCWHHLYRSAEVKDCIRKVRALKYAEEVYYDGTLIIKAFSSGLEIGASNWTINGPGRNVTYLSSSIFDSGHAMDFDYHSLQGNDIILFSDFSSLHNMYGLRENASGAENQAKLEFKLPLASNACSLRDNHNSGQEQIKSLIDTDENSKEMEKLAFICSCALNSVKAGGSVLIPIDRIGIKLLFLEKITQFLDSSNLKVPLFIVSAAAEETLAFTNIIPEWLCKQRQQKFYSCGTLFGHVELRKEKKLYSFHELHSSDLLNTWQEPCIVFCPHWTLRTGPVVHLLHRWHGNENCLLVLEQSVDADIALLPFQPMAMKVLQCSFLSGIKPSKVQHLLEKLQPKLVLFPEDLHAQLLPPNTNPLSLLFYSENEPLQVPSLRDEIKADLATLGQENTSTDRLKGEFVINHGKLPLVSSMESMDVSQDRLLLWGCIDVNILLLALQEKGIIGFADKDISATDNTCVIQVSEPRKALIQISRKQTMISTADESLGTQVFEVISNFLDSN